VQFSLHNVIDFSAVYHKVHQNLKLAVQTCQQQGCHLSIVKFLEFAPPSTNCLTISSLPVEMQSLSPLLILIACLDVYMYQVNGRDGADSIEIDEGSTMGRGV
jgi:hypothetical protein